MKKNLQDFRLQLIRRILPVFLLCLVISANAQMEDFEGETISGVTFTTDGTLFNMTGDFRVNQFDNFSCGGTNTGANRYIDTGYLTDGPSSGLFGSIAPASSCISFRLDTGIDAQWGWTGSNDGDNEVSGSIQFIGTKTDQSTISEIISFAPTNTTELVVFTFANGIWGGQDLIKLEMEIVNSPTCDYFALDELVFEDISDLLPTVNFTAPSNLCIDAGIQNGLGGGIPTGGTYSGPGVTDNGNGSSYSFNPVTAGVGNHTITYTYNEGMGCSDVVASGNLQVFALPTLTFTAPPDLCLDAGILTGGGGGTPNGGVYSGPGITDGGNGLTYSFNPATAGVGVHTITYSLTNANGCSGSATDIIQIFNTPNVTFTAPADLCIDTGIQTGLGGGTPSGGDYTGLGVTDNGNGTTYSFNPTVAGDGVHSITYNFTTANGCSGSATDNIEVFDIPNVTFSAPADLCISEGTQTGLGGGTPIGGGYNGMGVTDDGNGITYTFNPTAAGIGAHSISYSFTNANGCSGSAVDDIEVFDTPNVAFTAPDNFCLNEATQNGLGGGTPTGGTYSGPGVMDDGNGSTFTFDPSTAGAGTHSVTYSFSSGASCSGEATDLIEVFNIPTVSIDVQDTIYVTDGVPPTGVAGGGTPVGGVYNDNFGEVDDDGNGTTFSFNNTLEIGLNNFITYTYTDVNGCSNSITQEIWVLDEIVGVDDLEVLQIEIFPNPTAGIIEIPGASIDQIDLIDIHGKILSIEKSGSSKIDISAFPNGIYFLKLTVDDQIVTKRIIKI